MNRGKNVGMGDAISRSMHSVASGGTGVGWRDKDNTGASSSCFHVYAYVVIQMLSRLYTSDGMNEVGKAATVTKGRLTRNKTT